MERTNMTDSSYLSLAEGEPKTTTIYAVFTDGTSQYVTTLPDEQVEATLPSLTRRAVFRDVVRWNLVGQAEAGQESSRPARAEPEPSTPTT